MERNFVEAVGRLLINVDHEERAGVVLALAASIDGEGRAWRENVAEACRLVGKSQTSVCEETAPSVLADIHEKMRRHQHAFQTMKSHHEKLKQGEEVGEAHYIAYANASLVTGRKGWLMDAFAHISDVASAHFGLTDSDRRDYLARQVRPLLRERRKAYFMEHRTAMRKEEEDRLRQALEASISPPRWWRTAPVRLVDIGSCHHPFRENPNFTTTALDLQSGHPEVFACDFLEVPLEESFRILEHCAPSSDDDRGCTTSSSSHEEYDKDGDKRQSRSAMHAGAGDDDDLVARKDMCGSPRDAAARSDGSARWKVRRLLALPSAYFHIAVMSLMLSYVPHAHLRARAILKARALLQTDGILIISEAVSALGKRRTVLVQWTQAIECAGFTVESPWEFYGDKVWIAAFRADERDESERRFVPLPLFRELD